MKKTRIVLLMTVFTNITFASNQPFENAADETAYQSHCTNTGRHISRARYANQHSLTAPTAAPSVIELPAQSHENSRILNASPATASVTASPTTNSVESDEEMALRLYAEFSAEEQNVQRNDEIDPETLAAINALHQADMQTQGVRVSELNFDSLFLEISDEQAARQLQEEFNRSAEPAADHSTDALLAQQLHLETIDHAPTAHVADINFARQLQEQLDRDVAPVSHAADAQLAWQLQEELNYQAPAAHDNTTTTTANNYIRNYVHQRQPNASIVQNAIATLAPAIATHDEIIETLAPDSDVHIFDGFYATHSATVLGQLRALRLGGNEVAATLTSEHALLTVQTMLNRPALEGQFDTNALREQLPTFCNDFSEVDQELFSRMADICFQLTASSANQCLTHLRRIPENWEQHGGCLQGRQDRNLLAIIGLLGDLGLRQA